MGWDFLKKQKYLGAYGLILQLLDIIVYNIRLKYLTSMAYIIN